jgi:hypothetical protein
LANSDRKQGANVQQQTTALAFSTTFNLFNTTSKLLSNRIRPPRPPAPPPLLPFPPSPLPAPGCVQSAPTLSLARGVVAGTPPLHLQTCSSAPPSSPPSPPPRRPRAPTPAPATARAAPTRCARASMAGAWGEPPAETAPTVSRSRDCEMAAARAALKTRFGRSLPPRSRAQCKIGRPPAPDNSRGLPRDPVFCC